MGDSRVTETAVQSDHPDDDLPVVKFSRRTGLSDEGWFYTYRYSTLDEITAVLTRRDVERCTPLASLCLHAITQKTGISSLHLRQFVMGILIPTDFHRRVLQETWIGRLLPPPTHFPESLAIGETRCVRTTQDMRTIRNNRLYRRRPAHMVVPGDHLLTYRDSERRKPAWILITSIIEDGHFRIFYSNEDKITRIPDNALMTFAHRSPLRHPQQTESFCDVTPEDYHENSVSLRDHDHDVFPQNDAVSDNTIPQPDWMSH